MNLQEKILHDKGFVLYQGKMFCSALLKSAFKILKENNLNTTLQDEIERAFNPFDPLSYDVQKDPKEINKSLDCLNIFGEVFDYFSQLSPNGYYFGINKDDGNCVGWFKEYLFK